MAQARDADRSQRGHGESQETQRVPRLTMTARRVALPMPVIVEDSLTTHGRQRKARGSLPAAPNPITSVCARSAPWLERYSSVFACVCSCSVSLVERRGVAPPIASYFPSAFVPFLSLFAPFYHPSSASTISRPHRYHHSPPPHLSY